MQLVQYNKVSALLKISLQKLNNNRNYKIKNIYGIKVFKTFPFSLKSQGSHVFKYILMLLGKGEKEKLIKEKL